MKHSVAHSIHMVQTFKACPDLEPFSRLVTVSAQPWLTTDIVICKAAISTATVSVDPLVTCTYLAHHELESLVMLIVVIFIINIIDIMIM